MFKMGDKVYYQTKGTQYIFKLKTTYNIQQKVLIIELKIEDDVHYQQKLLNIHLIGEDDVYYRTKCT